VVCPLDEARSFVSHTGILHAAADRRPVEIGRNPSITCLATKPGA
jgi:hypothetical protein